MCVGVCISEEIIRYSFGLAFVGVSGRWVELNTLEKMRDGKGCY